METLVCFAEGPQEFYDQIKPLAIRHMKYGVTSQMIKVYGKVVSSVLGRTLGEK